MIYEMKRKGLWKWCFHMCKVVPYLSCTLFGETHTLRTLESQLNLGCSSKPSRHWASMTYHSRGCDHHACIHNRYTHTEVELGVGW